MGERTILCEGASLECATFVPGASLECAGFCLRRLAGVCHQHAGSLPLARSCCHCLCFALLRRLGLLTESFCTTLGNWGPNSVLHVGHSKAVPCVRFETVSLG